jgi:hypothetical protein
MLCLQVGGFSAFFMRPIASLGPTGKSPPSKGFHNGRDGGAQPNGGRRAAVVRSSIERGYACFFFQHQ